MRPSPSANAGQEDGFSSFRAAASDAWSGASASILSNVNGIVPIVEQSMIGDKLRVWNKQVGLLKTIQNELDW